MKTSKLLEVREKANDQVAIIFSFTSGWLGGWHMSSEPITKQSLKKKTFQITFDIQLIFAP